MDGAAQQNEDELLQAAIALSLAEEAKRAETAVVGGAGGAADGGAGGSDGSANSLKRSLSPAAAAAEEDANSRRQRTGAQARFAAETLMPLSPPLPRKPCASTHRAARCMALTNPPSRARSMRRTTS